MAAVHTNRSGPAAADLDAGDERGAPSDQYKLVGGPTWVR
ncbi:hypothetical protein SAFG77S_02509 [Streptomyces afghaniensis]